MTGFTFDQQNAMTLSPSRRQPAGRPGSRTIFEVQAPDGTIYEVDAPDEQSAIAGFHRYMESSGMQGAKSSRLPAAPEMQPDLARVKRNVAKMAAQNAPEADIDGYIASEGVTIEDVRNFRQSSALHTQRPATTSEQPYDTNGAGGSKFRITAPDGRKFHVTGENADGALEALREHLGGAHGQADQQTRAESVTSGLNDAAHVATGGLIEGVPIVGPYIREGAERVGAGIRSWMYDTEFQNELDFVQGRSQQLSEERPILDTASKIGGAVAGTVPAVMAAPTLFGAGGGGLLSRMALGGASGGAIGAVDSGARSDWDSEAMMWGGGAGLGAGIVAPIAGKALGAGWQRLRDWRAVREALGSSGLDKGSLSRLSRAVADDGLDPSMLGQRMRELGPDAMLMDAGPNLQQQAGALAATPGRGQEVVRSALDARQAGSAGRIGNALDDALGQSADTLALANDIVTQRAAAARPLYSRAYEEGADGVWSTELERMAGSPMFSDAMRSAATRGQDRAVLDGFGSFNPRVSATPDGRIVFNQTKAGGSPLYPDLQYWDYVKRELDDIAGAAARAGKREEAGIASNLSSRLRTELDNAVPSYRAAREAYSGPSAILDALEEGQSVFRNSTTPGQLRRQMEGMGQAERDAFTQGARSQIADIMGTARNDAGAARALFQRGFNRDKLNILLGEAQAGQMLRSIEAETAFAGTRDIVTRNSLTASRQAAMKEVGFPTGPQFGVREGYMSGGTLGAARSAGVQTFERFRDMIMGAHQQARNSGLAEALSSKDYSSVVDALQMSQGGQPVNQALVDRITRALMYGGGIGAARP